MAWECFLIEPTDRVRRWLRRYSHGDLHGFDCAHGYHTAKTLIEDGPAIDRPGGSYATDPMECPRDDPRWPTHCTCGYAFRPDDPWQLFYQRLYRRTDTGADCTIEDAPIGAMWFSDWHLTPRTTGPDGHSLSVMTPGGPWDIDWPSVSGGGWTRTGTPPHVTASPSIHAVGKYHGFLQGGVLTDDLEGRSY